ncbi:MAG: hypothetical protein CMP83_08420 [Gammaproteobacteria bacterium]|nr:hypothetical protein [Gammaproteobacteria bacterium]
MAATLHGAINHGAYYAAVACVITLCVWSIVYLYTKAPAEPQFTDVHMILSQVSGTSVLLLLLTWLHKSAK